MKQINIPVEMLKEISQICPCLVERKGKDIGG